MSRTFTIALLCAVLLAAGLSRAEEIAIPNAAGLTRALEAAKAGQTLVLPAGAFTAVALPAGVNLRGAGPDKTTIDAGAAPVAVSASGAGVVIENLSIRAGGTTAIEVANAQNVAIRRVKIRGGAIGIRMSKVSGATVENVVTDGSLTGMVLTGVSRAAVVNCTLCRCNSLGMSLVDVTDSAVFNNVVADAGIGMMVGGNRTGLRMDYNLYLTLFIGKLEGQTTRTGLAPWRDVTGGFDAASVILPVKFADADKGDYRVTTGLEWAPWRATTSEWGAAEFAGVKAPLMDIDGRARIGAVDLGACETGAMFEAKPDGSFTVSSDAGVKSAGLFTKDGVSVRYLFHNLPLKKGSYGYLLPARNTQGQPIPAGDYELRVAEGNLRWKYRGMVGNNGLDCTGLRADHNHIGRVAWAADGSLLLGLGWNERGQNLLKMDTATRSGQWAFNGSADNRGLAVGSDGTIYLLRGTTGTFTIARIDPQSGKPREWAPGEPVRSLQNAGVFTGLAELDGKLYLASSDGKLYITSAADPKLENAVEIADPSNPVADRKHKLVWLVSGEKVLALDAAGAVKVTLATVAKPAAVATNGARLAVASHATGKVHFFDIANPAAPRATGTLGRGDGPYGPIVPDRFWFQEGPYTTGTYVAMDLDAQDRLTLNDGSNRVLAFDKAGKVLFNSFAHFGNAPYRAYFDDNGGKVRFFDNSGTWSWFIDPKAGNWQLDAYWGKPPLNQPGGNPPINFFSAGGKKFGAYAYNTPDGPKLSRSGVLVVRFDNYVGKPAGFYTTVAGKGNVVIRDTNNDGIISLSDGDGTPLTTPDGKPVTATINGRWIAGLPDGSLHNGTGQVWKLTGVDNDNNPVYEFPTAPAAAIKTPRIPSPYDYTKQVDLNSQSESAVATNGDLLVTLQGVQGAPNGMGLSNSGGLDLARFAPDGTMKWYLPADDYGPLQGVKEVKDFVLTSWGHQTQWIGLDEDGLEIGELGYPAEMDWQGYWVDHPQQYRLFMGNDGQAHVTVGDYMKNCQYWLTLENWKSYKKAGFPVTIDADKAAALAAQPARPVSVLARPAQPRITVPRLKAPLPIDGELAKWRAAGVTPQIVVTPVTAGSGIDGPADASGVIRLAYEGNNLYVQVLRFDDVVTFHQTIERGTHIQDTVEMMINGFFPRGFQFSVSRFATDGEQIVRRRFFFQGGKPYLVPADHAPRVVKVLDNAKDVEERKLIEASYGVDLSNCKVIVTEFKLPIDNITWKDSEDTLFEVGPGKTFWIGFMLDDNDVPGTDVQNLLVYPASYSTFDVAEKGALATFE